MAIFHLSLRHISRSTGKTSVQSAAYITATSLYESRRSLKHNYSKRKIDIACYHTCTPVHAPKEYSELSVWDKLEDFEDEYAVERFPKNLAYRDRYLNSARTAMIFVVALPKELPDAKQKSLVDAFSTQHYVAKGLVVSYAIYNDEKNPHAQLQVSRRSVNDDGTFSWAKNREMCSKKAILETRTFWAELTNRYLEADGVDASITEKSFAERGIDADPTRHHGRIASEKLKS